MKQNELVDEPEDNFWILTVKAVLSLLVTYSLCILVFRFIRICQRFKVYQSDAATKQASEEVLIDELDENNNPIGRKIRIGEIGKQQHISQRNSSQQSGSQQSGSQENGSQESSQENDSQQNDSHPIVRSRPSRRSGRISSQIVKLNQADIGQVKLISLLILSATFIVLLVEIAILIRSNSLVLITVLTAFALVSMICNFKNNFDSIGQINFLIFIIERTLILCLSFVNRFNLYKSRTRRRCSIRIDQPIK